MGMRFNKLSTLFLFSFLALAIPLASIAYADHGGSVDPCIGQLPYWDPNTRSCVDSCPGGFSPNAQTEPDMHCTLVRVGGELIPLDTSALLVAGAQMNASWMIPVIVSVIGIGIVLARKF